jgi:TPR repeat protein
MELQFFKRYAREGSSIAYLALAIMNYRGQGKPVNISLANRQLRRSAQQGEPAAQYQLGYFLMHGVYMKKNEAKAINWFKKAARYDTLDSHKMVSYLTKKLNQYNSDVYSLEKAGSNLIKSDLALQLLKLNHQENPPIENVEYIPVDEVITIEANFKWADVLAAAKQQTCNQPTCKRTPINSALVPRIVLNNNGH